MTTEAGSNSGRGRPRDLEAQQAILEATRELLGEAGYTHLTIGAVALRAKSGKATIYRWWPTKGDLVLEAVAEHISIGTVPDTGSTREDLLIAVRQLIKTFSDPLARLVIHAAIGNLDGDPGMARVFREKYVYPWRQSAMAAIERGLGRGDLPSDLDAMFTLDVIVGTVLQRTMVQARVMIENLDVALTELIVGAPSD